MFTMTRNVVDSGEGSQQGAAQTQDSLLLLASPRVTTTPVIIKTTNVSNPDSVCIVAVAVSALNINRTPDVDRPVSIDNIMIPDVLPSVVLNVVATDRLNSDASVNLRSSAMKHNFVQMSHIVRIKVRGIFF